MSSALLFLLPLLVLGGLVFVLFVGRRQRNVQGQCAVSAPGSPETPIFAEPEVGKRQSEKVRKP